MRDRNRAEKWTKCSHAMPNDGEIVETKNGTDPRSVRPLKWASSRWWSAAENRPADFIYALDEFYAPTDFREFYAPTDWRPR